MIPVSCYCRVSTDHDDQLNSLHSQLQFFREYIQRNPQWQLHEIYADEGITGTSTKKRTQFNRMIRDAQLGKFSLIITKEVSRFSRNLLDTIAYTRQLKAMGVGVIFMNDGFSSLDPDAELRLSIMGSIAQEESRKTSARVKWGQTRQMERGVVFGRSLLGYDVHNGKMTIEPEGAQTVKKIFQKYGNEKKGTSVIIRELLESGCRTGSGSLSWSGSYIIKILRNEKYAGDLIQKKTVTTDYLTHEKKRNRGQEEMVVLRNHHEPIVDRDLWNTVQAELKKRNRRNCGERGCSVQHTFSGKIFCETCGSVFICRTRKGKSGVPTRRWACSRAVRYGKTARNANGEVLGCGIGRSIRDDVVRQMIRDAVKSLDLHPAELARDLAEILMHANLYSESELDPEKLLRRMERIREKKNGCIDAFVSGKITERELEQMRKRYQTQLEDLQRQMEKAVFQKQNAASCGKKLEERIESMLSMETDGEAFPAQLLARMTVRKDAVVELKLKAYPAVWYFDTESNV